MTTDNLTWVIARASGMVGYLLVTSSIAFGIALSLKVRSPSWPRFVTTEVHRRVTLLALVFTAVHGVTLWLDPFTAFTPPEIVVPLASHYRAAWIALGIVASDLMLALWLSERLQRRIGYGWWRRLHYLTFAAWALVTVHGLASGSDTRTPWAAAIYAAGTLLVLGLLLYRLWPLDTFRRLAVLTVAAASIWLLGWWAVTGPLRAGWNDVANDGNGSGQRSTSAIVERVSARNPGRSDTAITIPG
jgi:sulfoxide reductase heme-binding subunit YedZ